MSSSCPRSAPAALATAAAVLVVFGGSAAAQSRSTTYCNEGGSALLGDCWASRPADAPACGADTAKLQAAGAPWSVGDPSDACRCSDTAGTDHLGCDLELGRVLDSASAASSGALAAYFYCASRSVYVAADGSRQDYCLLYHEVAGWGAVTRSRNELRYSGSWWSRVRCSWTSGFEWRDGRCRDSTRHLFETCWDGWGECAGDGLNHLACATVPGLGLSGARCVPGKLYTLERNRCDCSVFSGGYFWFACASNDCNGHACVLTTQDMNRYCDYSSTDNNWRRDRREQAISSNPFAVAP